MPFEYEKPENVAGEWVNMQAMAKLGEAVTLTNGFLSNDPTNLYQGDPLPRYVVAGKVKSTGDDVKISCPNGKDYSRNHFLQALDGYLKAHVDETVDIKFVKVAGSNYVDIEQA